MGLEVGLVREGERQQRRRSRDLGGRGRRGGAATAGGVAGLEDCSKDAAAAREEGDVWCVRAMCVGAVCVGCVQRGVRGPEAWVLGVWRLKFKKWKG